MEKKKEKEKAGGSDEKCREKKDHAYTSTIIVQTKSVKGVFVSPPYILPTFDASVCKKKSDK